MIARLAALLIAGALLLPAAAAAQPSSAAADPAALDLARLLMSRDQSLYDDADLGRYRARIESTLLGMAGTCDSRAPECHAAASQIAARLAPIHRQHVRERSERLTAAALAARMRTDEMSRVSAWLRSDEGRHFLHAWAALRDPDSMRERRRALEGDLAESDPPVFNTAIALFRRQSRGLPQAPPR